MWDEQDVAIVPITWLKPHEEVHPRKLRDLLHMSEKWQAIRSPILVDKNTGVILDGHHRHAAAQRLELDFVPVIAIDYLLEDSCSVEPRQGKGLTSITKKQVIEVGLSEENLPCKSTKHHWADELPVIWQSFESLRNTDLNSLSGC